jgi:imidazolonepropionase
MNMKISADLIMKNIGQLLSMDPTIHDVSQLGMIEKAALAICGDKIIWLGTEVDLSRNVLIDQRTQVIDVGSRVVMPGLIDCHTHLVHAGQRADEFSRRIKGDSYEEILAAGGGIHSTVKATRQASEEELFDLSLERIKRFISFGVTTIEAKSGYGLNLEDELKILRVIAKLKKTSPADLVATFLGAHVVDKEYATKREAYVDLVIKEMIPQVAKEGLAEFCDVFCEQGAFSIEESRKILQAGLEYGLMPKIHGEQLTRSGAIDLAIETKAVSIDHLEHATPEDAKKLAKSKTIAVILPGATYFLGKDNYADGKSLADAGCKVSVSTDFNPGSSHSENLPLMLNMACLYNGLTIPEALLGATRYAAEAIAKSDQIGTLEPNKQADILVLDTYDYKDFIYHFGINHTYKVFKRGMEII